MADEKEKKETTEEEKKGGFSGWWNKTKSNISNNILESNIESKFNKENKAFLNYNKNEVFSNTYYGRIIDDSLLIYGKRNLKSNSVIVDKATNKAYYVISNVETKTKVIYEGVEYERDATLVKLDSNVEEVNVIKAGDKYYIYKG